MATFIIPQQKNKVLHTRSWGNSIFVRYETPEGEIETKEIPVQWFFAIRKEDKEKANKILEDMCFFYEIHDDPKFPKYCKVFTKNIKERQDKTDVVLALEDNGIETFEGDVKIDKFWYINKQVQISDKYKKLYFDIETDDSIRRIQIGRDRIVSWAAIDDKGKKYFEILEDMTDESEKKLLIKFLKLIKKYDILLGWNSKEFDIQYLKERMRKFGINETKDYEAWRDVATYDLLKRFRHIFRFDTHLKKFSLEFISQHFLGRGKIKHTEMIHELYRDNKKLLEEYNIEDCILVKELDEKLGVSNMMILQSQWCGVPPAQFGLYSIIDAFIMKTAHNAGEFCKTSVKAIKERETEYNPDKFIGKENPDDTNTDKAKYTGAAVIDPLVGMYDKVYTFDFKSLYPSMMRSSNIGFDSIEYEDNKVSIINPGTAEIKRKSGTIIPTFFKQEPSVINIAITELLTKRKEYKKIKLDMVEAGTNKGPAWERVVSDEIIVKELANSTYGIMGLEYGRYYSVDVAESITLFGQWVINFAKAFFESRGYKVIYGDTDSVFVASGKDMNYDIELDLFHIALKKELKEKYRINECSIELEFDKLFERLILIAKKTYVGHVTNIERKKTDDIYARGLDYIKKNTFTYAATKQKELIDMILKGNLTLTGLRVFLDETKKEFMTREFTPRELVITQKIGKNLKDYKNQPLHVRLAQKVFDKNGENLIRTEIEYIITGTLDNKIDGVILDEYVGNFDRNHYWENKTQPVLERITKCIYPDIDDFFEKPLPKIRKKRILKKSKPEQLTLF